MRLLWFMSPAGFEDWHAALGLPRQAGARYRPRSIDRHTSKKYKRRNVLSRRTKRRLLRRTPAALGLGSEPWPSAKAETVRRLRDIATAGSASHRPSYCLWTMVLAHLHISLQKHR
jgi:hypothetical protein